MALLAHYKLDNNAEDCSGNGYHGTPYNMSWADGKIGRCGSFNGSSAYIKDPDVSSYLHGKAEASISLWCKKNAIQYGFLQLSGYANGNGNLYPYDTSTKVYLDVFRTNRLGPIYMHSSVLEWHHVIILQKPGIWQLYQNGALVHQTTANETISTNYLQFEIGRNSSSRYANALMDDVRVYDHALTQKEIKELSRAKTLHYTFDPDISDESGFQTDPNSINCNFSTDSKIKTQSASFDGATTNAVIPNTNKYLSPHLGDFSVTFWMKSNSTANERILNTDGNHLANFEIWKTSGIRATIADGTTRIYSTGSINIADNTWHHIAVVYNRSGNSVVYIDTVTDPAGTNNISSMADIDIDPATLYLGSYGTSGSYRYTGLLDDLRFFNTALSETDIKELFQTRASLDINGDFHVVGLNETWHKPLMIDYTTWQNGQTGSVTGFTQNGSTTENYRILGVDPWNKETVVWEARPEAASGADGGWVTSNFSVDNTKTYRFSVWVYRTVQGNGSFYLGTNGYGSVAGVYNRSNGSNNTNPYFLSGSITPAQGWQLIVGHIWPAGSGTGSNHPDSGRYNINGRFANISLDFVWRAETTSARHRSYLYYSTDINTRQRWAYPRVDICDGTEPSINDLLSGFDSRNIDYIRSKGGTNNISLDVGSKITTIGELSETGPVQDLAAWWPLNGDADDYSGYGNHGTVNGAVVSGGVNGKMAYSFDGADDYIGIGYNFPDIVGDIPYTLSAWIYLTANTGSTTSGSSVVGHASSNGFGLQIMSNKVNFGYRGNSNFYSNTTLSLNTWYYIIGIGRDGNDNYIFINGVLDATYTSTAYIDIDATSAEVQIGWADSRITSPFPGKICDVRIYKKALTPSEINILYSVTGNAETRMKQTKDHLYLKGQLKEV